MEVYLAFNSYPDYSSGHPAFKSAHQTFEGAKNALFPGKEYEFRPSQTDPNNSWYGPDGYGLIRKVMVHSK